MAIMQCIGRTKSSNFHKRCNLQTRMMFCWRHVWQPLAAIVAIAAFSASVAQLSGYSLRDLVGSAPPAPVLKILLSAGYDVTDSPTSDYELERGGRSLLLVAIPKVFARTPNQLVLGTFTLRPVNVGSLSLSGAQLTTIISDGLWDKSLGEIENESIMAVAGVHEFGFETRHIDDHWISTRAVPRLDPFTGAPFPVLFVMEVSGRTQSEETRYSAEGLIEVRLFGPDFKGLGHKLDIRCISAESDEGYLEACRALAKGLREEGYPNVPTLLVDTNIREIESIGDELTVVHVDIDGFIAYGGGKLFDF